ncbi:MAG: ATP-binding cassette domain-containing protein [Patescibacteria group bacterium]
MKHLSVDVTRYEVDGTDILRGLSCVINENDRIGMVGANGAGKTTFMKIITGDITAYDGSISNTGSMSLGYLSQIHFDVEDRSVKDELRLAYTDILRLEQELTYAEEHMDDENGVERYSEALEKFHIYGGYDYEREIDRVARGLGIFELINSSIKEIS